MADFDSSLPVRTETAGDIVAKLVDTGGVNELAIDANGYLTSLLSDGTNTLSLVVANSAFGATPTLMPIAGKYEATPTTYTDGDAVPLLTDANGRLQVDIISGGGTNTQDTDDDSIAAGQTLDTGIALGYGYDGAAWERLTTDGSGSLDVNVTLALPAGANSIGTVGLDAGSNLVGKVTLNDGTSDLTWATIDSAYGATPTAIRMAGKYEATPTTYADGDATSLLTDANGRLQVDVVSGGGTNTQETDDDSIAGGSTQDSTVSLAYGYDGANWERLQTDGSGSLDVNVTLALPTGSNTIGKVNITDGVEDLAINTDGSINVNIVNATVGGEIHDYDTTAAVAAGASDTHTYTVSGGTTLLLKRVQASGSGKMKVEVKTGPTGTTVSQAVAFSSTANPNIDIIFDQPIEVAATNLVEVIRTNRDKQAKDVYSYVNGQEV